MCSISDPSLNSTDQYAVAHSVVSEQQRMTLCLNILPYFITSRGYLVGLGLGLDSDFVIGIAFFRIVNWNPDHHQLMRPNCIAR